MCQLYMYKKNEKGLNNVGVLQQNTGQLRNLLVYNIIKLGYFIPERECPCMPENDVLNQCLVFSEV